MHASIKTHGGVVHRGRAHTGGGVGSMKKKKKFGLKKTKVRSETYKERLGKRLGSPHLKKPVQFGTQWYFRASRNKNMFSSFADNKTSYSYITQAVRNSYERNVAGATAQRQPLPRPSIMDTCFRDTQRENGKPARFRNAVANAPLFGDVTFYCRNNSSAGGMCERPEYELEHRGSARNKVLGRAYDIFGSFAEAAICRVSWEICFGCILLSIDRVEADIAAAGRGAARRRRRSDITARWH
ncbi:hypothetical protein EVAR_9890_1 [Eumeta japonica]|uniref:Uncharacterized protein n=1 Tax=Eumeta variegata TaxID=151549 RepID=A0A4C1TQC1_EUMVA|nr:hypothetical protein EVAR_9890_1 [Eumeta japonica]